MYLAIKKIFSQLLTTNIIKKEKKKKSLKKAYKKHK